VTVILSSRSHRQIAAAIVAGGAALVVAVLFDGEGPRAPPAPPPVAGPLSDDGRDQATLAPQGPTAADVAEAREHWQPDVEVVHGRDVVSITFDYVPEVDLNFPQSITVTWSRCTASDGVHREGDRDDKLATGTLDPHRWEVAGFVDDALGDRNRNGVPDVVVRTDVLANGWTNERVHLFELSGGRLVDLLDVPWLAEPRWPIRFDDVDHDGIDELVTFDKTWELDDNLEEHARGPHAEFVVEFRPDGSMYEDGRSRVVTAQIDERKRALVAGRRSRARTSPACESDLEDADANVDDDDAILSAAGSLLILELALPAHDVAGAVRRFRQRVSTARINPVHAADVRSIEHHAITVDAERARPPR
jgi:hypothetical protein